MDRDEYVREIHRVEDALKKTRSEKLRRDYTKYLRRLKQELNYYDRQMMLWEKRT